MPGTIEELLPCRTRNTWYINLCILLHVLQLYLLTILLLSFPTRYYRQVGTAEHRGRGKRGTGTCHTTGWAAVAY